MQATSQLTYGARGGAAPRGIINGKEHDGKQQITGGASLDS